MERLDLRLLDYFIAVAEELHFGRAAQRLHIAQPSLSQQIRRFELQLGVTLLDRTSRQVQLTAAGEALLREGRRTLEQAQRTIHAAQTAGRERLTVGFYGSAASQALTSVLQAFEREQPQIDVVLRELELSHVAEILESRVDVAFTRLRPGESRLEVEVIDHQPRVAALPSGHRLGGQERIALSDLRGEPFITQPESHNPGWRAQWLAEQARHGLSGQVGAEATSIQEILTLIAAGRGVCLVPASARELYPRSDIAYVDVADAEPAVISLAWPRETLRPATTKFIELVRRHRDSRSTAAVAIRRSSAPVIAPATPTPPAT
jgi:DNA-binding transcriptional LysR family regulator